MREPLLIAAAQPPCVAYDVATNALTHADAIRSAKARVVVFPELSLTGYQLDASPVDLNDPRLGPLVKACDQTESIALVGAPIAGDDGRLHIAMLAVDDSGVRVAYRKLWVDSTESRFDPGDTPEAFEVDGWRLGLAICKDTGIAQHVTDTVGLGVDAYVAGTLMHAGEAGTQEQRAQRIAAANDIWVVFASFAGPTGSGYVQTEGCSGIWDPDGIEIARAGPSSGAIVRATLTRDTSASRGAAPA